LRNTSDADFDVIWACRALFIGVGSYYLNSGVVRRIQSFNSIGPFTRQNLL
jgi:hypothetical protein